MFADLDNDGVKEIIFFEAHDGYYYQGYNHVHVVAQNGENLATYTGPWNAEKWFASLGYYDTPVPDIFASTRKEEKIYILSYDGNSLTLRKESEPGTGWVLGVEDLDGDGSDDVIVYQKSTGKIKVLKNDLITEIYSCSVGTTGGINSFAISDLNNDGKDEMIVNTDEALFVITLEMKSWTEIPFVKTRYYLGTDKPREIAVSNDGTKLFVGTHVTSGSGGKVKVLDAATGSLIGEIDVGYDPIGIALTPDNEYGYVTNTVNGYYATKFDAINYTKIGDISTGTDSAGVVITPDGDYAYMASHWSSYPSVIEVETNSVHTTISGIDDGAHDVEITPDGKFVYTFGRTGNIYKIDTSTNTIVNTVSVTFVDYGADNVDISPDGSYLYVPGFKTGKLHVYSTQTDTEVYTIDFGTLVRNVVVTPDGRYAYVGLPKEEKIKVIDTETRSVVASIDIGASCDGRHLAVSPDGRYVYIPSEATCSVIVIDTNGYGGPPKFKAPYVSSAPSIDGVIDPAEWTNAKRYDFTFVKYDCTASHKGTLWFQHDGQYLYIGLDTNWASGWDVYACFRMEGDHNHLLAGSSSEPHKNITFNYPSPGGWSGYNVYRYLSGTDEYDTTPPEGTAKASSGEADVTYEFKIKISDLGSAPGKSFGFWFYFGTDGTAEGGYHFPDRRSIELSPGNYGNPAKYPHIELLQE
jgi:YVTN family beta-propeller protein